MRTETLTAYRANLAAWPASVPLVAVADAGRVRVEESDPHPTLLIADAGQWVSVHSRRDPVRDAERSLAAVGVAGSSTLFVIGLGLGWFLDVLEQQGWAGKVVALEPEPACVDAFLRRRDWGQWFSTGRLTIVTAPSYEGLDGVVPALAPNRDEPVVLINPAVARACAPLMDTALRRVAGAWFAARANQDARRRNGGRYLLNTLRNASAIAESDSVDRLADLCRGLPAVLVAAGPSLNRNLAELASLRDRAIVVAVDTALRTMLQVGIEPDFVVAVDPSEANARHLVDLPSCANVTLVAEGSLDPEAMRTFRDRLIVFRVGDHHPWPWLRGQHVDAGVLRAWGSVLTTAFDLALKMGCNPIVFTGADLGFTEGQPYARGTTYEEDWRREEAWGRTIEASWAARVAEWPETVESGIGGLPVRTAPHLRAFRDWLVTESGRAIGRRIVNATGRGILVGPAVHVATLGDVLRDGPPIPDAARCRLRMDAPTARSPQSGAPMPVAPETMAAWREFGQVSEDAIERALGQSTAATRPVVELSPILSPVDDGAVVAATASDPRLTGLSAADVDYITTLGKTHTLRWLELLDANQDLAAQLRLLADGLAAHEAVVIVDRVAQAVGGQVRRAVDALLCERLDLWLDYRRFVDQTSAVSVIHAGAATRAPDPAALDLAKWDPTHEAIAERLTALIVEQLHPHSVVDVGCGAGYWLEAFERRGVERVLGLTPGDAARAVHPAVRHFNCGALSRADSGASIREASAGESFEVCLALEVAQELPPTAHAGFVAACADLSAVVAFSSRIPGAPNASPFARPLAYWAALFWQHGYVLEDTLRPRVNDHWGFPWTLFDVLVVFRRVSHLDTATREALATCQQETAARVHELYQENVWWSVRANALQGQTPSPPERINTPRRVWCVPAWRMSGEPGEVRTVAFRTDAARWYLTDPRAEVHVVVDGRELPRLPTHEALAQHGAGGWVLTRDELTITSGDGSDPRCNGREYGVDLPAFVAWAEEQSLADCLSRQL